jgi:hypothetical protein
MCSEAWHGEEGQDSSGVTSTKGAKALACEVEPLAYPSLCQGLEGLDCPIILDRNVVCTKISFLGWREPLLGLLNSGSYTC